MLKQIVKASAVAALLLGATGLRADDFWSWWGDGKAELDGYALTQPRYGHLRHGRAVLIFVTEDHSYKEKVKIEGDSSKVPASERYPVLKLNIVREFQTGIYKYNVLTSVFARLDRHLEPSKISESVQEWCGHVYQQFVVNGNTLEETLHSYFGGEADQIRQYPLKTDAVFEDEIPILIRELQGEWVKPGQDYAAPCAPSLLYLRFHHQPFIWQEIHISKSGGTETLASAIGRLPVRRWTIKTPDAGTYIYYVEAGWPHRIIKWHSDQGEAGVIKGSIRLPYWALHDNGDEKYLHDLGF